MSDFDAMNAAYAEVMGSHLPARTVFAVGALPARAVKAATTSVPIVMYGNFDPIELGLVGSLVFFFATEPARRRAVAQGRVPFPMPDSSAFLGYLEELTLRGLAPETPPSRLRRKGAHV